jgi:hypothetical protein
VRQIRHKAQRKAAQDEQHRVRKPNLPGDNIQRRNHYQQKTDQLDFCHGVTFRKAERKRKKEEPATARGRERDSYRLLSFSHCLISKWLIHPHLTQSA